MFFLGGAPPDPPKIRILDQTLDLRNFTSPKVGNTEVIKEKDPEISWKVLEENLFSALDGLAPMSEMKVSQNPPPWMDEETRDLIKRKNSFLKKAHKTGKKEDWIEARRQRNSVNKQIKSKKSKFIVREARSKNPKKIWSVIRQLIPSEKRQNKICSIKHQ